MNLRRRNVSWPVLIYVLAAAVAFSAAIRPHAAVGARAQTRPHAAGGSRTLGPDCYLWRAANAAEGSNLVNPAERMRPASLPTTDFDGSSMLQAIRAAWAENAAERAALATELANAADATVTRAVRRRIEAAEREMEVRVLRIQAAFARDEGRLEVAQRLETTIEKMRARAHGPALP
jgi:hypothetical protein